MLERLHLKNVGPAPELEMEFAPRVNLITGDNGLGKSFLLEVGWFILTGGWAGELNPRISAGKMPHPSPKLGQPLIKGVRSKVVKDHLEEAIDSPKDVTVGAHYDFRSQSWSYAINESFGLTIQLHVDGGFSVFDSVRGSDIEANFLFSPQDVWDGLTREQPRWGIAEPKRTIICNGLIRDWGKWQLENGEAFQQFKATLASLSPHEGEKLEPGKLTRVSLDDARDFPTLKMPYGQEVPITQASAGIRRVVSLAYMLVWTWQEHLRGAELTRQEPAREIVLLIDELEQHLHPRWQRVILPALLETVKELMKSDVRVQIIATTHSPFVMASLEPLYDDAQDAWFDLNLVDGAVTLERMPWYKRGGIEDWAISEAFDLDSSGSVERERALEQAAKVMDDPKVSKTKFLNADKILRAALSETDEFWVRWRFVGEKRGWL